ncbi:MAG TPA: hypothetical protein DC057_02190 [Spirochaetia bacterium]|nr:hypothetical protein [Spirochaetia bacterium]
MDDTQNILNRINRKKSAETPMFDANLLSGVHKKVLNKLVGTDRDNVSPKKGERFMDQKVEQIIANDKKVREAVQNLVVSLTELGDSDIAMKLIGQHIIFLNDMFKEFDQTTGKK